MLRKFITGCMFGSLSILFLSGVLFLVGFQYGICAVITGMLLAAVGTVLIGIDIIRGY